MDTRCFYRGLDARGGTELQMLNSRNSNPFTPKSDKFQISPARSPEILSYSIKNVAFHSLLRWKMINLELISWLQMILSNHCMS